MVSELKPIQNEVNIEKVNKIIDNGVDCFNFLVSKENGLVDGTHRHLALLISKPNKKVTIYKSEFGSKELIDKLNKLKETFSKELHENKSK